LSTADRRARFRALHARPGIFLLPNPWDVGSALLLQGAGFEALATTSQGMAWCIGKRDTTVTRDELLAHVAMLAAAVEVPLAVDSERCFADDPAGVAETVRLLGEAGAAGVSIEDYDPATDRIDAVDVAAARVAAAARAAHGADSMVLTARCENHLHGVDDLDDTIHRLLAYEAAGADCVYAPGLRDPADIAAVIAAVRVPVNVLPIPGAPTIAELGALGARRASTGSMLTSAAYGALMSAARELQGPGTTTFTAAGLSDADRDVFRGAGAVANPA